MHVHFDNCDLSSRTGPNSFAQRLAKQLMLDGHIVTFDEGTRADVSLVFIESSGHPLARKIVQRLDGIWSKPAEIDSKNARIKELFHRADGIVFQSKFDAEHITAQWGHPAKTGLFRIIHNGIELSPVDSAVPLHPLFDDYETVFVCSANWHRSKRLKENTEIFLRLREHHPNSCLIVLGSNPDHTIAHRDVFYAGSLDHEACLQVFARSDWMIHAAFWEHSPNTVVEALSQGCAVVCSDFGGTKELVGGFGVCVPEAHHLDASKACDYDDPPALDTGNVRPLPDKATLGDHADIDIRVVSKRYVELFERVLDG